MTYSIKNDLGDGLVGPAGGVTRQSETAIYQQVRYGFAAQKHIEQRINTCTKRR